MIKLVKEQLDEIENNLYTAVLCDVMDNLGFREQAMRCNIRPMKDDMRVVGHAATLLAVDVYEIPKEPYQVEIEAIDALEEGQVVVISTNGSSRSGIWGELLGTASRVSGARGAIVDGLTRDGQLLKSMGWPVFSVGQFPADSKGRTDTIAYNVPIECGGIMVHPGDLIVADNDGVIVIPNRLINTVVQAAMEKVSAENTVRNELEKGARISEVFRKYRVL